MAQGEQTGHDALRRSLLLGGGLAVGSTVLGAGQAAAQTVQTEHLPTELDGNVMPEPPAEKSAGPIRPGRGSMLTGKVAVVTGAARGIGRAIAVEFAANGADVVVLDICGPVSTASNAQPATAQELAETVDQIRQYGRKATSVQADIRDRQAAQRRRPGGAGPRQARHRRRQCGDPALDAADADAGR